MNLLFDYKILDKRKCGFPESNLEKVMEKLNNNKIDYHIIYTYQDPIIKEFSKLNKYMEYYDRALKNIDKQKRIDLIIDKIANADSCTTERILEMLENV